MAFSPCSPFCCLFFNYLKESPVFNGNFLYTSFMTLLFSLTVLTSLKSFMYVAWNIFTRMTSFMGSSITKWWLEILENVASTTASWINEIFTNHVGNRTHNALTSSTLEITFKCSNAFIKFAPIRRPTLISSVCVITDVITFK